MQRASKIHALLLIFLGSLLSMSCGSYNRKIQRYYSHLESGRYNAAYRTLDNIAFLQKPRNRFLYYAEKGKMAQLMGLYDSSNALMNQADLIADFRPSAGDKIVGTLLNPMMETYYGEPFERLMLNYYKAINYASLGNHESALVEARRITIATNQMMDSRKEKDDKYSRDAFSYNIQGMIYEMAGDRNNAFIAYRNAAETYLSQKDNRWFGVGIPGQLQQDVLRMADANGFTGEVERFSRLFNTTYRRAQETDGGELVLFIENGRAPVKEQETLMFSMFKGQGGSFHFADPAGSFSIPFDMNRYNTANADLSALRTFWVALPKYIVVSPDAGRLSINVNGDAYQPELIEDLNTIARQTMQENRLNDITSALTRLVVKKLAEAGARAAVTSTAKNSKADSEQEQKKNEQKAEAMGAAVGLLFQAFSIASEKADTRNWQSLPAYIQYVRVPLNKGINRISIAGNGHTAPRTLEIDGRGGLQLRNVQ